MKSKIKGYMLLELIIAIFLISIISLGLYKSVISLLNINKRISIIEDMQITAKNLIESSAVGATYNQNTKYEVDLSTENYNEKIKKISVVVKSTEIDEEVKYVLYYKKNN